MVKNILTVVAFAAVLFMGAGSAWADEMDRHWCMTLLEIKDDVAVPDSVAEPMARECVKFQDLAIDAIMEICVEEDLDTRKGMAEQFNHLHKDEYNLYIQMIRNLKAYLERKCLGPNATQMSERVVETNADIDRMFTIFRSRRPLTDARRNRQKSQ